eukprot:TRINITY_DN13713_c0_g1_i3.p3 TRINITY_DN13713_c0_g1~~TRINITY_DN13713_c0_g1_i3.p3  ORF type:complete len:100 (-),score=4.76 TRINITY_DN13713_c0_g1_i3:170-469(-)
MMNKLSLLPSYDKADGGFLNSYFRQTSTLPFEYNAIQSLYSVTPSAWDFNRIRVVHYMGAKPWSWNSTESIPSQHRKLHELWWKMYLHMPPEWQGGVGV